jgi:CRP-like cAMP-binding protein
MHCSFKIIKEFQHLNSSIQTEIASKIQVLAFAKNEYILKKGDVCQGVYIIQNGCCRSFIENKGKEITTTFSIDYQLIYSAKSYFAQAPSTEYIQALEDTSCFFISRKDINLLLEKYVEFNTFVRKINESLLLNEIDFLNNIRTKNAFERYEHFMEKTPQILQRVPLGHLASFLGMSQETLSRMRSKV